MTFDVPLPLFVALAIPPPRVAAMTPTANAVALGVLALGMPRHTIPIAGVHGVCYRVILMLLSHKQSRVLKKGTSQCEDPPPAADL